MKNLKTVNYIAVVLIIMAFVSYFLGKIEMDTLFIIGMIWIVGQIIVVALFKEK